LYLIERDHCEDLREGRFTPTATTHFIKVDAGKSQMKFKWAGL
jgi:hypothetical protein